MMATRENAKMVIQQIRLANARHLQRLVGSQAEFIKKTGIGQSRVSQIIGQNPRRRIGESTARRIEKAFGLEEGWLDVIHQEVDYPSSIGVKEPTALYHNVNQGPDVKGEVPMISWVAAGDWCQVYDDFEPGDADETMPCPVSHGPRTYCLTVRGISMEPEFHEGEVIFVDPDRQPENGDFVVVRLEDKSEATFKRLRIEGRDMWLEAVNPAWPEKLIKLTENAIICGVVIFQGRPR